MKSSKILPWVIFGLVLVLASMTLGRSSGYYDLPASMMGTAAPGTVAAVSSMKTASTAPAASAKYPAMAYTQRAWIRDYPGNDIGMITVKDRQECAKACNNAPGCVGFVMDRAEKKCLRKTKMANPRWNWRMHSFALPSTTFSPPPGTPPQQRPKRVCMDIGY